MKVAIRTDAALHIGTGHVMRCLTLGEALRKRSVDVEFICRAHEGNFCQHIEQQGFKLHTLPNGCCLANSENQTASNKKSKKTSYGLQWLGSTQEQDAALCRPLLENMNPDWLIVDHYAIDQTWQRLLSDCYGKLMVIDDLAARGHLCDLLLDQTYGRKPEDYADFVPKNCQLLLGSQYALLRPEFFDWREYSLKRRANPELKKLLITLGGIDLDNTTCKVLEILKTCALPKKLEINVVMGATAPHLNKVRRQAETMPYKTTVKVNISNMAEIMANSDLAIGAGGTTTWERFCLGLPCFFISIAQNQMHSLSVLRTKKVISMFDINMDLSNTNLNKLTSEGAKLVDGLGCSKVVENIWKMQ